MVFGTLYSVGGCMWCLGRCIVLVVACGVGTLDYSVYCWWLHVVFGTLDYSVYCWWLHVVFGTLYGVGGCMWCLGRCIVLVVACGVWDAV